MLSHLLYKQIILKVEMFNTVCLFVHEQTDHRIGQSIGAHLKADRPEDASFRSETRIEYLFEVQLEIAR